MLVEEIDVKEIRKIVVISDALNPLQIEIFNKWKINFLLADVRHINLGTEDKLRVDLNSKCQHPWQVFD